MSSQQLVMSYGAAPHFPAAGAQYIYAPDYRPSVLNAGGTQAGYLEGVNTLKDLSGNARDAVFLSGTRPAYLPYEGRKYLWMFGIPTALGDGTGGGSRVPYHASMLTDDMTFEIEAAADDWTPAVTQTFGMRWVSGSGGAWITYLYTNGTIGYQWFHSGGAGNTSVTSTAAVPFANFAKGFVRINYTRDTGSGQYAVIFSTSTDGVTWTQLGTTLTGTSTGATLNTNSPSLRICCGHPGPAMSLVGRLYSFKFRAGGIAAAPVVNWDAGLATHMSYTSVESAQGLTFSQVMGPDANQYRALIGKGSIAATVAGEAVMSIANPMATSSADYITGMLHSAQQPTQYAIGLVTSVASGLGFGVYHTATGNYAANNDRQIGSTYSPSPGRRVMAIARQQSGVGYMNINGTTYAPAVPASTPSTNTLNRLFRAGTIQSIAVHSRIGHWVGALLPTPAEVEAYLEG